MSCVTEVGKGQKGCVPTLCCDTRMEPVFWNYALHYSIQIVKAFISVRGTI